MDLKELLGEELYNQVAEKAGDNKIAVVSDGSYIPKEKFDDKLEDIKGLKKQLEDRDDDLKDLRKKAKDSEELQGEIDTLQEQYDTAKETYEKQLQEKTFNYELEKVLSAQKARNVKSVKANLDIDKIKLDGDKLLGLDEQLTALKESDGYLFGEEQPAGLGGRTPVNTGKGNQSTGLTKEDFKGMGYQERVELYQNDPETYKQLNN